MEYADIRVWRGVRIRDGIILSDTVGHILVKAKEDVHQHTGKNDLKLTAVLNWTREA